MGHNYHNNYQPIFDGIREELLKQTIILALLPSLMSDNRKKSETNPKSPEDLGQKVTDIYQEFS